MDEEIVVDNTSDYRDSDEQLLLADSSSEQSNLSYSTITELTVDDIDIYQPAFIGFGVVGASCMMCYGMIVIIHLFRRVM